MISERNLSQSESEESEPEVEFEDELVNIQRIFFFYLNFLVSLENVLLSVCYSLNRVTNIVTFVSWIHVNDTNYLKIINLPHKNGYFVYLSVLNVSKIHFCFSKCSIEYFQDFLRSLDPKECKDQDHYRVLGLAQLRTEATDEQIRKAYR